MTEQTRPNGTLRHLLTLEGMPRQQIEALLTRAQKFVKPVGEPPVQNDSLAGVTVANLFTEPSTRTRVSFELAAKRLGADVVNLEVQLSSRVKGESMLDTIYTLEACHVDVFVIRDAEAGVGALVATHVKPHVSVLSAGEAHIAHPTQGLLDALTILQAKTEVRWTEGGHRRRRAAFARRALCLARARDARRRGDPHRRAARVDASRERIRRLRAIQLDSTPVSPTSTSS